MDICYPKKEVTILEIEFPKAMHMSRLKYVPLTHQSQFRNQHFQTLVALFNHGNMVYFLYGMSNLLTHLYVMNSAISQLFC